MLSNPPLNQHFDRSWLSHVSVKATLYEAETQNQAAIGLHAEQEVAPEIARIKVELPPISLHKVSSRGRQGARASIHACRMAITRELSSAQLAASSCVCIRMHEILA